jgi:diguanylate cyclase (GGDEF)-like protein
MAYRLLDAFSRHWYRLVTPERAFPEVEMRRIRLLAEVLLALILLDGSMFILFLPVNLFAYRRPPPVYDTSVIVGAALILYAAYRLVRRGRYQLAAQITIGATSATVWISVFVFRDLREIASVVLVFCTLPVMISRLLLSARAAVGVLLGNGVGFVLVPLITPDMSPAVWLLSVLISTFVSVLSIMAGTMYERHLTQIEAQRRSLAKAEDELRRLLADEAEQRALAEALRAVGEALGQSLELDSVLDRILEQIGRVIPYDAANIMLLDEAGKGVHVARVFGYDQFGATVGQDLRANVFKVATTPNLRSMAETQRPLIIPDTAAYPGWVAVEATKYVQSWAGAPIVNRGKLLAFLSLDKLEPGFYRPKHAERLALFTSQAGIAIENARLYMAIRNHARERDALLTASGALLSTLELEPLLQNILFAAMAAIPAADKGTILLVDPVSGRLEIRALAGYSDPRVGLMTFAGSDGYSAKAMRERRSLLIPDARADPAICYEGDILEVRAIQSAVVVPLLIANREPQGVISLDSTQVGAFTESDLRLLVAFANTANLAIDHARLHAEVQNLAVIDGLTGLANRRAFDLALSRETERADRAGQPLALLVLDLDSFKAYNDLYGHPAGDERLRALADLLRAQFQAPNFAARYGGEEFAVILPHTGKPQGRAVAERLRAAAEATCPTAPLGGPNAPYSGYTVSIGVAVFPDDAKTREGLLQAADAAELAAKHSGKNRVCAAGDSAAPRVGPKT